MRSDDILRAQRNLRSKLLDDRQTLPWQPARDLAAQLLLYLDDPNQCWKAGAEWLREMVDADRVDGGFAQPGEALYAPQIEALRSDRSVPSVVGVQMNALDPGVAAVWASDDIVVFNDVAHDGRMSPEMRAQLRGIGTRTKLSVALRNGNRPLGLMCADWMEPKHAWTAAVGANLTLFACGVLGPVLAVARQLAADDALPMPTAPHVPDSVPVHPALAGLTSAELKIARMVARGMSYKEIARELNRSFSTVDHQLRSVRDKLGAPSTARLVRMLADLLPAA
ncbi:LuxR C-terminal-related transcriptional regulator [Ralstonia soli]|uniref:LuxR C-terminal-related transcriptional regulator n=1 Tax=Ralstonia soli TaxID=2953896 RepID=A0ABT1AH25_9RALS|nr:LuxR C-terminal-related transcriptional regulator [Ralstonia soli]MCO5397608.1 LuxR C-terminal-related transcriptional regulator [Ralstonia soli]